MLRCPARRLFVLMMLAIGCAPCFAAEDVAPAAASETPAEEKPAAETPKYLLEYKFAPGQVVHLVSEYQAQMKVRHKEISQVDKNVSRLWKHYRVITVSEDGSATLELQLDRTHQQWQFGDNPPEVFKSDDPKFHHPKFRDTLAKIGKPTANVRYSPQGKLLSVHSPEAGPQTAANGPPQDHQGFLFPLPDGPIAVGTKWKDQYQQAVRTSAGLKREIDMLRVYELKSVEGDIAKVSFSTAILTPVHNEEILVQLLQRQNEGTFSFDMQQGLIVEKLVTVDQSLVNAFGQGTSMHAVTKLTETVNTNPEIAANKPAEESTKN